MVLVSSLGDDGLVDEVIELALDMMNQHEHGLAACAVEVVCKLLFTGIHRSAVVSSVLDWTRPVVHCFSLVWSLADVVAAVARVV